MSDEQIETGIGSGGHGRLHIIADRRKATISIVTPPDSDGELKATSVVINTADLHRLLNRVDALCNPASGS